MDEADARNREGSSVISERLKLRDRPDGSPFMHQTWGKLLFLHWSFPPEQLLPLLPEGVELDTFNGRGWVGITPFTMWKVRPPVLPAIPKVSETHELNVRTYVHREEVPGIWFFSLDASNPLAVAGARALYHLPYFHAGMKMAEPDGEASRGFEEGHSVHFTSTRRHPGASPAHFEAAWRGGASLPPLEPGTLDFFLIERYALYAERRGRLYRGRIHHKPWELREAELEACSSSMLTAVGLSEPELPPLVHAQRDPLDVEIWPLERV